MEGFENPGELTFFDPDSRILDHESGELTAFGTTGALRTERDTTAAFCELHGVPEEIQQDLPDCSLIGDHGRERLLVVDDQQCQACGGGTYAHQAGHVLEQLGNIDWS